MRIPKEKSVAVVKEWEESFFQSEFTHAAGIRKHTQHQAGVLGMWRFLEGKKNFPPRYLIKADESLTELVNNHDTTYRNENRGD